MGKISIYLEKIWDLFWRLSSSVFDFMLYKFGISSNLELRKIDNVIVYVGEELAARISRIVARLKMETNYNYVLLVYESRSAKAFHFDQFNAVVNFRNKWHLKRVLLNLPQPIAAHTFGPFCKYPAAAIEHYNKFGVKTIYDLRDVLVSNFGLNPPFAYMKADMEYERYCFAHADKIVSYSLEPLNVRELYGIHYKDVLFFPNYLDYSPNEPREKLDGLHLVYAGSVAGSDRPKAMSGTIQFFWLIETLSNQKIHFHVYPTPSKNVYMGEYEQLDKDNPYFHLHKPVPQKDLAYELSQYHFGILPFFNEDDGRAPTKRLRSTSQKVYNYTEAGIPVLISEDLRFQGWIAKRIGAAKIMKREDFGKVRDLIGDTEYKEMVQSLLNNRKNYYLKDRIGDIVNLYSVSSS